MHYKLTNISGLMAIFFAALLISCEKQQEIEEAPVLPPFETMAMDFSHFNTTKSQGMKSSFMTEAYQATNLNWIYSATVVGFWNTALFTTLAIPVASFKTAFTKTPVYLNGQKFQWTYLVDGFASQYQARLTGEVLTDEVVWEMYISKTGIGSFDEILWFSGSSNKNRTQGHWVLNQSASHPEAMLRIDWLRENDALGNIKYTYIREKDETGNSDKFMGSSIVHGLQLGDYDLFYDVHTYNDANATFVDADIEWSSSNYFGRVMASHVYNDNNWHCWNSEGVDVDCE